jgi:hypothetical protein
MKTTKKTVSEGLTRRELLKGSGLALGGLAFGSAIIGAGAGKALSQQQCDENACGYPNGIPTQAQPENKKGLAEFVNPLNLLEAAPGFEPGYKGFADLYRRIP